jgi:thiaminase/transcriptional activator TenA
MDVDTGSSRTRSTGAGGSDAGAPQRRPAGSLTAALWTGSADIVAQILAHPFLRGLSDGTLPHSRFAFYLAQDGHYVRSFAQCLASLAARAPGDPITRMLLAHADQTLASEVALHRELAAAMGLDPARLATVDPCPTTEAYRNWLLALAARAPFVEALVALLPCYWVYAEVARRLQRSGSPDPVYQQWIDSYGGTEYETAVLEVLECLDRLTETADQGTRERAGRLFRRGTRYEWMFWDAADREEQWPV